MRNNFFYMGLGGGANSSLHPPFRRKGDAPATLHPPPGYGPGFVLLLRTKAAILSYFKTKKSFYSTSGQRQFLCPISGQRQGRKNKL